MTTLEPIRSALKKNLNALIPILAQAGTLKGQPDFDEFTEDVLHSDSLSQLLVHIIGGGMIHLGGINASIAKLSKMPDVTGQVRTIVESNFGAFESILTLMFISVKIGRQLEKDEMALLNSMDLKIDEEPPASSL